MMEKQRQCAICGESGGCGRMIMGHYICLGCQRLLEDPKKKVYGCSRNRRFARGEQMEEAVPAGRSRN